MNDRIMALLRRPNISSFVSTAITNLRRLESSIHIHTHTHTHPPLPSPSKSSSDRVAVAVVDGICDSLRKGCNWDTLSQRFDSVEFSTTIVDQILLQFKEPADAKRALRFFHWSAHRFNFQHPLRSYSIAIHILVRARLLLDARALLESILKKHEGDSTSRFAVVDSLLSCYKITMSTPFVFDLLIQTYSKLRMFHLAFDVLCYLDAHGFSLNLISFNTLIRVVHKSDQNPLVWKIYEHMIQKRTYPNAVTIRIMVSVLCKEGKLQKFVDILDRILGKRSSQSPMLLVNTSLIFRIIEEEGRTEQGMVLLKRMLQNNMILDSIAFSLIVYAEVRLESLDSAQKVYEEMLKRGFHANPFVYTSFIGAYCRGGRIEEANGLMEEMEDMGLKPYEETFNFLIEGCARAGRVEGSLRFCEKMMERGLLPSCLAFNEMVGKLCEMGDAKHANATLTLLLDKGFVPDEITYSHLIAAYGNENEIQQVLKIYYEMEYRSMSPGILGFTSFIRSLCQCGKLGEAEKYLEIMKGRSLAPSVHIYETLIACHFEKGDKTRALQLYKEMISQGLKPNSSYFCGLGVENMES